jgi:hypothetical protein
LGRDGRVDEHQNCVRIRSQAEGKLKFQLKGFHIIKRLEVIE